MFVRMVGLMIFLLASHLAKAQPTMSEYQVKALFLLNFIKYVDWPAVAMPGANAPLVIGIMGKDNFNDYLTNAIDGRSVKGRAIVIKHLALNDAPGGCAILFIRSSATASLGKILANTGTEPVLTVGEDETFLDKGGIINFKLDQGKIRLEINLKAAQKANLQISSKLLNLADTVKE